MLLAEPPRVCLDKVVTALLHLRKFLLCLLRDQMFLYHSIGLRVLFS